MALGPHSDSGSYEDSKFFNDPGKTQEPINNVQFHGFLSHFTIYFPHYVCDLVEIAIEGRFIYHCSIQINSTFFCKTKKYVRNKERSTMNNAIRRLNTVVLIKRCYFFFKTKYNFTEKLLIK